MINKIDYTLEEWSDVLELWLSCPVRQVNARAHERRIIDRLELSAIRPRLEQ
jgi:hypothetical protein